MASIVAQNGALFVRAYRGDAKTLLAFDLDKPAAPNLAGFTIECRPEGMASYFLLNELQFERPADHAQVAALPANSSVNAPIHKFRWLHVPGAGNQGTTPVFGKYRYTITPRYFDDTQSLRPLDAALSASLDISVAPFTSRQVAVGFTRGFVQSQAYVRHFGPAAVIEPEDHGLQFDTSQQAGVNAKGQPFTFADEYRWLGFTARERVFELLDEVAQNRNLTLDVFAYDLDEPDIVTALLTLAARGSVRMILDNAALHHSAAGAAAKPEDEFEAAFARAAKPPSAMIRGKFLRYSHHKVFIVSDKQGPLKVLTGSTNLSVTGLYVNSNHVLVFDNRKVAAAYSQVFNEAWQDGVSGTKFRKTSLAAQTFTFASRSVAKVDITFAPHEEQFAGAILDGLVARIGREGKKGKGVGSVLFAVMDLATGGGPIFPALKELHADESIFSYGISDNPDGIALYEPGKKRGVLVTGKPAQTRLPKPFSQVPNVGRGHQIHHKFVVCGFNGPDPVVYCGSSNLALGGEQANGDNLLAIHDGEVATAFAIEAMALVDHFTFLDRAATKAKTPRSLTPPASKQQAAVDAHWYLSTNDKWTRPYFDSSDLRSVDRRLFAQRP